MNTQNGSTATSFAPPESRDGSRVAIVRVSLDGERLRGKWQTICIDLEKILGPKFGLSSRFEL